MPRAMGVERSNARIAEYNVPQMNGSAPKSPETGSHVFVTQKLNPNFSIDNRESCHSTTAMPTTRAISSTANAPVKARKLRSPPSRNGKRERATGDTSGYNLIC